MLQVSDAFADMKARDETIAVLKETLGEQENMLQLQEEYINKKEAEISSNKTGNTIYSFESG